MATSLGGVRASALLLRVREAANMEAFQSGTSQFVTDAEVYRRIDEAATGLYDMLISALGEDYFVTTKILPAAAFDPRLLLPRDFYRLVSLHEAVDTGGTDGGGEAVYTFFPIEPFQRGDMTQLLNERERARGPFKYRLRASRERFETVPNTAETSLLDVAEILPQRSVDGFIRISYIPRLAQYDDPEASRVTAPVEAALTDADPIYPGINGWEEHVVLSVAIRLLAKEESDTSDLRAERDRIEARILAARGKRDVGRPERVTNVRAARLASVNRRGRWDDL